MADEFYVGYAPEAPAGVARRVRQAVIVLFVIVLAAATLFATRQQPFAASVFEYGTERAFTGLMRAKPYPSLLLLRPGKRAGKPAHSSYLLVAPGKHGVAELAVERNGQLVRLSGTLIHREGRTMLEIVEGSVETIAGGPAGGLRLFEGQDAKQLGQMTLVGEIVDSKCWLGVMKPARLKPHRACATRCISGGIPPLFLVQDGAGRTLHFLLVGDDGESLHREVLDKVAEPLEVTGRVIRHGDWLVLYSDPQTFRRL